MHNVRKAQTDAERGKIYRLRYKMLRQPWEQPYESAYDALEETSINLYVEGADGEAVACGRLQENEGRCGQIRYMAVDAVWQGKGLGKLVLLALEREGIQAGLSKIQLQARENALDFYLRMGYTVKEKSFLLWGKIQHYLMEKSLEGKTV